MKEIVVISGKGGTGKTSITSSFAVLAKKDAVIADCDVDAADMHLIMQPENVHKEDFYSGFVANIDDEKCIACGKCQTVCRFDAVSFDDSKYSISALDCEGCGYCARVCPSEAIEMKDQYAGEWYLSKIKTGSLMVHAKLGIGAENSGKLVAKVKNTAKQVAEQHEVEYIIIDGSPGIGCPVVSSLSGANYVVLVTEPTMSGLRDLKRVYELVKKFNIPAGCIINKSDLNPQVAQYIVDFLKEESISMLAKIPYSEFFTRAMVEGKAIVEHEEADIKDDLVKIWDKVLSEIKE
jgi:MinD superfamily P-loop ATPase